MRGEDIRPQAFPAWDPRDVDASLDALAGWVEGRAQEAIDWYLDAKRSKARWSRRLRFLAIALATVGATVPFVSALADGIALQWGYLAFALAGAAMAFDRFFGLSTAWMRYITAEIALQGMLKVLQLDRAALRAQRSGAAATREEVRAELALLSDAIDAIQAEVADETRKWVAEFQSNVAELNLLARGRERSDQ